MKLWQKTYLLSTILCALILYGCMFSVTAPASVILTPCPRRPKNAAIIGVFGISCCRKEVIFRKIFGVM